MQQGSSLPGNSITTSYLPISPPIEFQQRHHVNVLDFSKDSALSDTRNSLLHDLQIPDSLANAITATFQAPMSSQTFARPKTTYQIPHVPSSTSLNSAQHADTHNSAQNTTGAGMYGQHSFPNLQVSPIPTFNSDVINFSIQSPSNPGPTTTLQPQPHGTNHSFHQHLMSSSLYRPTSSGSSSILPHQAQPSISTGSNLAVQFPPHTTNFNPTSPQNPLNQLFPPTPFTTIFQQNSTLVPSYTQHSTNNMLTNHQSSSNAGLNLSAKDAQYTSHAPFSPINPQALLSKDQYPSQQLTQSTLTHQFSHSLTHSTSQPNLAQPGSQHGNGPQNGQNQQTGLPLTSNTTSLFSPIGQYKHSQAESPMVPQPTTIPAKSATSGPSTTAHRSSHNDQFPRSSSQLSSHSQRNNTMTYGANNHLAGSSGVSAIQSSTTLQNHQPPPSLLMGTKNLYSSNSGSSQYGVPFSTATNLGLGQMASHPNSALSTNLNPVNLNASNLLSLNNGQSSAQGLLFGMNQNSHNNINHGNQAADRNAHHLFNGHQPVPLSQASTQYTNTMSLYSNSGHDNDHSNRNKLSLANAGPNSASISTHTSQPSAAGDVVQKYSQFSNNNHHGLVQINSSQSMSTTPPSTGTTTTSTGQLFTRQLITNAITNTLAARPTGQFGSLNHVNNTSSNNNSNNDGISSHHNSLSMNNGQMNDCQSSNNIHALSMSTFSNSAVDYYQNPHNVTNTQYILSHPTTAQFQSNQPIGQQMPDRDAMDFQSHLEQPADTTLAVIKKRPGPNKKAGKQGVDQNGPREFNSDELAILYESAINGIDHRAQFKKAREELGQQLSALSNRLITEAKIRRWFLHLNNKINLYIENGKKSKSRLNATDNGLDINYLIDILAKQRLAAALTASGGPVPGAIHNENNDDVAASQVNGQPVQISNEDLHGDVGEQLLRNKRGNEDYLLNLPTRTTRHQLRRGFQPNDADQQQTHIPPSRAQPQPRSTNHNPAQHHHMQASSLSEIYVEYDEDDDY